MSEWFYIVSATEAIFTARSWLVLQKITKVCCPVVSTTGHIKDPVPLIETSRASWPSPSFIHQVIRLYVLILKMAALDADRV